MRDKSFTIHRNIQAVEMYKTYNKNSNLEIFSLNENSYNTRHSNDFYVPSINSVFKGKCSIRYLGPVIWNMVPSGIKDSENINIFCSEIRKWEPKNFPCRLCLNYVDQLGFVEMSN